MFGFNKNNNAAPAEAQAAASRPTGDLAKVLDESVWESVFEDLKANKHFIIKDNGRSKYIGFLLDTAQFGGLAGKDAKKDESKGSIIEAIRTGRIKTYLRTEMLFDGCIVIIPDRDTIENMDEFNLFNTSEYIPCTIDNTGEIVTVTENGTMDDDDPEKVVTFDVIKNLVRNEGDINILFSAAPVAAFNNAAEQDDDIPDDPDDFDSAVRNTPAPEPDPVRDVQSEEVPPDDGFEALDEDYDEDVDDLPYEGLDDVADTESPQDDAAFLNEADDTDYVDENQGGYDEYQDINEDIVSDFVTRTMYASDLALEISTQPFDMQFLHANPFVPFNENRGEGYLNELLSNMSKDANSHLERVHSENLFHFREKFMRMVQSQCSDIARELDITDPTSHYGIIKKAIEENKDKNLANVDSSVEAKRNQLEAAWQQQLDSVAETAANEARRQHIDRYGKTHERDLLELRQREEDDIRADYNETISRMNADRRAEASKLLDLAVNRILGKLSQTYLKAVEEETKLYDSYQAKFLKFIDDNRKDEKARIEALAEENRQIKKANEVRGEYVAKIKAMSAEFDVKRAAMQADLDRMRKDHEDEMRVYGQELTSKLEIERQHSASLQTQLNELFDRYKSLEDRKNAEVEERVQSLRDDNAAKDAQMEHLMESSKRANRMTVLFAAALAAVALAVGLFIGGAGKASATTFDSSNPTPSISESMEADEADDVSDTTESSDTEA